MRRSIIYFIFVSLAFYSFPRAAFGCSLILQPIDGFDESEYVFIGEVVGVAEPLTSGHIYGQAWGLLVRVVEEAHLPAPAEQYYAVFPLDLAPDCGDEGWEKERLLSYYPVGAQVRVIAKRSRLFEGRAAQERTILIVSGYRWGSIARNAPDGRPLTSARSVYDYREFRWPTGDTPVAQAYATLPQFELRKDLLRLRSARSERERRRILERLVYYPNIIDFAKIAETFLRDRQALRRLSERRAAWRQQTAI